jgi:hypothetical protein
VQWFSDFVVIAQRLCGDCDFIIVKPRLNSICFDQTTTSPSPVYTSPQVHNHSKSQYGVSRSLIFYALALILSFPILIQSQTNNLFFAFHPPLLPTSRHFIQKSLVSVDHFSNHGATKTKTV